jgi:hypothetical protein
MKKNTMSAFCVLIGKNGIAGELLLEEFHASAFQHCVKIKGDRSKVSFCLVSIFQGVLHGMEDGDWLLNIATHHVNVKCGLECRNCVTTVGSITSIDEFAIVECTLRQARLPATIGSFLVVSRPDAGFCSFGQIGWAYSQNKPARL